MKTKLKILCIGAHPDDVEISMGGSILKLIKKKHSVKIIDLSNGEPTPQGSPEIRAKEAEQAANLLGCERKTLDLPNRSIEYSLANRQKIAEEIRLYRPDIIFTHYESDAHPDHSAAHRIVKDARFHAKLTKTNMAGDPYFCDKLICFLPGHERLVVPPTFCIRIDKYMRKKMQIMRCYQSQFVINGKERVIKDVQNYNSYWGRMSRCIYAEPFYSSETISLDSPEALC